MLSDNLKSEMLQQTKKGKLAGDILVRALHVGHIDSLNMTEEERAAWSEMQSAAHLWAAVNEFGLTPFGTQWATDPAKMKQLLLRAEHFADRMEARADLRAPDSHRLAPEVRARLESEQRAT